MPNPGWLSGACWRYEMNPCVVLVPWWKARLCSSRVHVASADAESVATRIEGAPAAAASDSARPASNTATERHDDEEDAAAAAAGAGAREDDARDGRAGGAVAITEVAATGSGALAP